ncbi:MAG: extracellular solute-binding protein [Caldilineaceae bacterium]
MLLWHAWNDNDAQALDDVLLKFLEIHPDVNIKAQRFTTVADMLEQYQVAAEAGLGPDLLIAPNQQVRTLADLQLIDAVGTALPDAVQQRYTPAALDSLQYGGKLYGIPATLDTLVLYYDRTRVDQPATTLDQLLAEAAEGRVVAISTNFRDAFWGVQAFGGKLFDEGRRVILDRGGFANWLAWLKDARDAPGMILDSNREVLLNRFIADGVAYYVGYASELSTILANKPSEQVGVAVLPSGPNGSAGPFLRVQALLFSGVSSSNQRRLALEVAQFITNAEQQATLMRRTRLVPVNTRVRVNSRLDPIVASFATQVRTGVPVLNIPEMDAVFQYGGDAYTRVLEGVMEPAEAAAAITTAINEANGFAELAATQFECSGVGTIYLGHMLEGAALDALNQVTAQLRQDCPTIFVNAQKVTLDELPERLVTPLAANGRLDVLLAPQAWIPPLATQNLLSDLTGVVDAETLQRFRPIAVDALRYQGKLYGLPAAVDLDALYYNRSLVAEPARTLDDLRTQATAGVPITLKTTFAGAFWGVAAFGGQLFDQTTNLALDQSGFIDWLSWLKTSHSDYSIQLSTNRAQLERAFIQGESAYYLAGPAAYRTLLQALGADDLGVARLPAGPQGDAGPLLRATGFLFSDRLTEQQRNLALEFVKHVTTVKSQAIFMEVADFVPTNVGVEMAPEVPLTAFVEQTKTARVLPNAPQIDAILALGDDAYRTALTTDVEPATVVADFADAVSALITTTVVAEQ